MAHMLEPRKAEFLAHIEAGKTISQITRLMDVSFTHAARFAASLGVKARNGGAGPRVERKTRADITAERVRELFLYDPLTGHLTWRFTKQYRALVGTRAGMVHNAKHRSRYVRVDGIKCNEHRVIWLHVTGKWPEQFIDHKNGDATDNRWENLREASPQLNAENRRKARAGAKAGLLGVHSKPRCPYRPYVAAIRAGGKRYELGYFATAEEAHAVYVAAKRELHEGCTL